MPSAYTALIESGEVKTGKDFIRACLPQFGFRYVGVSNQKYQIVEEYNDYLGDAPNELEILRAKIIELESMPIEQFLEEERQRWFERRQRFYDMTEGYIRLNKLYDKIYQEVVAWDAPDDLKHIKKFALDQIKKSNYDGQLNILFGIIKNDSEPTRENIREIYEDVLAEEKRRITRLEKEIGKYWDGQSKQSAMLQRIENSIENGFGDTSGDE